MTVIIIILSHTHQNSTIILTHHTIIHHHRHSITIQTIIPIHYGMMSMSYPIISLSK
mgnify:CR=1 FL=1